MIRQTGALRKKIHLFKFISKCFSELKVWKTGNLLTDITWKSPRLEVSRSGGAGGFSSSEIISEF
jgi:hypothetical protein